MWRKGNRRAWQTLELLAEQAGVEVQVPPSRPEPTTPAEKAFALVHDAGFHLLVYSKGMFPAVGRKVDKKASRRLDNEMTPEGAARASVMLTLAVAETVEDEDAAVVREHFPVQPEDERFIAEAFERSQSSNLNLAAALICARALELACGFTIARSTPAFEGLGEMHWREIVDLHASCPNCKEKLWLGENECRACGFVVEGMADNRTNWGTLTARISHGWEEAQDGYMTNESAESPVDESPVDDELIDTIRHHAYELASAAEPPEHVVQLLRAVYPEITRISPDAAGPVQRETMEWVARLGYFIRFAEGTSVAGAGIPSEEVRDALQTCLNNPGTAETTAEGLSQCAARFAMHEPLSGSSIEDPEAEGSLLAVVPGVGREAQLTIAGQMCGATVASEMHEFPNDDSEMEAVLESEEYRALLDSAEFAAAVEATFRCWFYGYFLRAFEEYFLQEDET